MQIGIVLTICVGRLDGGEFVRGLNGYGHAGGVGAPMGVFLRMRARAHMLVHAFSRLTGVLYLGA